MRFAIALVTLLLAGVLVAAGIAQRTVWRPADHVSVAATVPSGARYVVIPGSVLTSHPGRQRLHIAGAATAFAAYGTTSDVLGWLSGEQYTQLRVDAQGAAVAPSVRTAARVADLTGAGTPDPAGSDLWIAQRSARGALDWNVNVPSGLSVIVASDGASAAPSSVSVSWPVQTATPLALPFIIGGGTLAVLGLLLYVWALVHLRRRRGPRRKSPPRMPKPPQPPKYRPVKPPAVAASRGRRKVMRRVAPRWFGAGVGIVTATAILSGCAAQSAPAAPTPAATVAPKVITAAVTEGQAARIVQRVAGVAAVADAKRDATALEVRFDGPALQLRRAAYRIKAKDKSEPLPQAIPTNASLGLILPEATNRWPRTLFAVVKDADRPKVAPLALLMVQADPRSPYRVQYEMALQPGTRVPDLPSAVLGGARLRPTTPVLKIAPADLAAAYGTLLRTPNAPAAAVFDVGRDTLVGKAGAAAKAKVAKALGSTAKITFSDAETDPASVIAMSTADAGALVSVNLSERWTVKPKRSGVTVKPSGGTKILSKTGSTSKGIASVYAYQLLFSVPSAGSEKPIALLGYAQGLVSAKEL